MNKNKICWVTPDCFIDCDMEIIPHIKDFDIYWIILFNKQDNK